MMPWFYYRPFTPRIEAILRHQSLFSAIQTRSMVKAAKHEPIWKMMTLKQKAKNILSFEGKRFQFPLSTAGCFYRSHQTACVWSLDVTLSVGYDRPNFFAHIFGVILVTTTIRGHRNQVVMFFVHFGHIFPWSFFWLKMLHGGGFSPPIFQKYVFQSNWIMNPQDSGWKHKIVATTTQLSYGGVGWLLAFWGKLFQDVESTTKNWKAKIRCLAAAPRQFSKAAK